MRLVYTKTGIEVKIGDEVTDFRGNKEIVEWFEKPHSSASTGRLNGYYPSVYGAEWIEREDR